MGVEVVALVFLAYAEGHDDVHCLVAGECVVGQMLE